MTLSPKDLRRCKLKSGDVVPAPVRPASAAHQAAFIVLVAGRQAQGCVAQHGEDHYTVLALSGEHSLAQETGLKKSSLMICILFDLEKSLTERSAQEASAAPGAQQN